MTRVLVLNLDYEPLNICNVSRAMKMVHVGKADVLHFYDFAFRTGGGNEIVIPSVVRLRHNVKKKHIKSFKVSRHGIYARDKFSCQYCGRKDAQLTLDHIYPRHLGGAHSWDNLVACCRGCNNKKGWKTLEQSGMNLLSVPKIPRYSFASLLTNNEETNNIWHYYIPM